MVKPQPALTYENIQDDVHRIILPDGSSVCLQHGASLAFIEKDGMRLAELRGEAFFDVARDSIHPFIVNTEAMDIRVLGTAFSVSATPG